MKGKRKGQGLPPSSIDGKGQQAYWDMIRARRRRDREAAEASARATAKPLTGEQQAYLEKMRQGLSGKAK